MYGSKWRRRVSHRKSRRSFRKLSSKVHKKNITPGRGGYRL